MFVIIAILGLPISQLIAMAIVDRTYHQNGKAFLFLNMSAWLAFFYLYAFLLLWLILSHLYPNLELINFSAIYILSITTLIYLFFRYAKYQYFYYL